VAGYCLIEQTIKYIEKLHRRVEELKEKRERLLATKSCLDDVNVCVEVRLFGNEIIIRITSFKMTCHLWKIYQVIEAQHFNIQTADIYRGNSIVLLCFHAH
ncbi:hypothetical protein KI387_017683, partial [Taxus chinensis]